MSAGVTSKSNCWSSIPSPIFVAPIGSSGLLWPRSEIDPLINSQRRCGAFDRGSGYRRRRAEMVAGVSLQGPGRHEGLVDRVRVPAYEARCLTIDCSRLGRRERDIRNGFESNPKLTPDPIEVCAPGSGFASLARLA